MAQNTNFTPVGESLTISATGTSASKTFSSVGLESNQQVRIVNEGTVNAYIKFGKSSLGAVTATTSDMLMLGNTVEVFNLNSNDTIAAITSGSAATINLKNGTGS